MGVPMIPIAAAVRTTCPYCGVGCGIKATPMADGALIEGDPEHIANRGRLCVKGAALGETLDLDGRLLAPAIREDGKLRQAGWGEALDKVASTFAAIIAEHGPDAVAMYVSGQLLTEDYYVANKFMKGFVGSANIDTNSRLCMSSSVAGHKRAFGEDLVPGCYEDFELADLIVLVGSNTAWCHPTLFQRIVKAKEARPGLRIVAIDPRRTATCELADLHLPVKAGTDVWLFNGLLSHLARAGRADHAFVADHTSGLDAALEQAGHCADIEFVARTCGVDPRQLAEFYELFAATENVVTAFSQGVNQSSSGTDKVNSIINCHLLTGRIGKRPVVVLHGRADGLIPIAHSSRPYAALAATRNPHFRFMEIMRGQHFDALLALPGMRPDHVAMQPAVDRALDDVRRFLGEGAPLPPSAVID